MCFFFLFYGFFLCSEFDVIFIDSAIFVKTSLLNRVGGVGARIRGWRESNYGFRGVGVVGS